MKNVIAPLLLAFSTCLLAQTATPPWQPAAGTTTLPLWPGTPPGVTEATPGPEVDAADPGPGKTPAHVAPIAGRKVLTITNVSRPTLTLYQPQGKKTGAAVLVFPGGGYRLLAIDLEGTEVCTWLNQAGIACVLVKYRVPEVGPYPKSVAALDDAQRAMGMVREHAAEWGIDPHRVGVLGFSAGAHLSAALSTHYSSRMYPAIDAADALPCRPDFAFIIYPGYLAIAEQNFAANPDIVPTSDTPPTFILQAENDPVHVENALTYFMQLKNAKVPAELHVYAEGGHGFGLRKTAAPITHWPVMAEEWLGTIGVLPKAPQ
jgi:acetyl esterase/lipase